MSDKHNGILLGSQKTAGKQFCVGLCVLDSWRPSLIAPSERLFQTLLDDLRRTSFKGFFVSFVLSLYHCVSFTPHTITESNLVNSIHVECRDECLVISLLLVAGYFPILWC